MRTRSKTRKRQQQQQVPPDFVEPFDLEEPLEEPIHNPDPPVVTMADQHTMAQLLQAPTEGYKDAIVVPEITAENFELKHSLLTLVQNKQFFGHDKEDPHADILYFNKITSTMKFPNVPRRFEGITTEVVLFFKGPTIPTTSSSPPKVVEREPEPVVALIVEPTEAPVSAPKPNPKLLILYPSRLNDQKRREKANDQIEKFYEIFKDLSFEISFTDALILIPKMDECLALADLGASINLMPLSMWKQLSLPELTPTCMTLELADRSIYKPISIAEDGEFISSCRQIGPSTFKLDQTSRYLANYNDMMANRIDVIDMACKEYSQEVLGFSDVIASGNPTPYYDPIVSTSSPTLTPFGSPTFPKNFHPSNFDAFLALEDDPTSPEVDHSYYDSEGDILLLEAYLNDDPSLPPPTQGIYFPKIRKELKVVKPKIDKSSIDEPSMVELKDLPPHLEYAYLEGDDKF
ncbi:hypothetical protein Tco_0322074 [Tanacetum coccineum]